MKIGVLALSGLLVCAAPAWASLSPTGDTVWVLSTNTLDVTLDQNPSSLSVSMTLTERSTGVSITADALAGASGGHFAAQAVYESAAYYAFLGLPFRPDVTTSSDVLVDLTDSDGLAFAGIALGDPLPVNPPPLALFESASVSLASYECGGPNFDICMLTRSSQPITAVPEPAVTGLVLASLSLLALRKKRAPEA